MEKSIQEMFNNCQKAYNRAHHVYSYGNNNYKSQLTKWYDKYRLNK